MRHIICQNTNTATTKNRNYM